jgi:hypothetical protein
LNAVAMLVSLSGEFELHTYAARPGLFSAIVENKGLGF